MTGLTLFLMIVGGIVGIALIVNLADMAVTRIQNRLKKRWEKKQSEKYEKESGDPLDKKDK